MLANDPFFVRLILRHYEQVIERSQDTGLSIEFSDRSRFPQGSVIDISDLSIYGAVNSVAIPNMCQQISYRASFALVMLGTLS